MNILMGALLGCLTFCIGFIIAKLEKIHHLEEDNKKLAQEVRNITLYRDILRRRASYDVGVVIDEYRLRSDTDRWIQEAHYQRFAIEHCIELPSQYNHILIEYFKENPELVTSYPGYYAYVHR